ncbi:MAG: tetratricopeptide repeat protein [Candidatus Aenigmatarchaeota archaeon]
MYGRIIFSLILVILFAYLYHLNPQQVTILLPDNRSISIPVVTLVLISFAAGVFFVIIVNVYRDSVNFFSKWKERRKKRILDMAKDLFVKGSDALRKGDLIRAKTMLTKSMELDPTHLDTYLMLADTLRKDNKHTDAITILNKINPSDREDIRYLFKLEELYRDMGELDKARDTVQKVIKKDEANLEAWRRLRDIELERKNIREAFLAQRKVTKLSKGIAAWDHEFKTYAGLKYEYARFLFDEGRLDKAKRRLKEIIRVNRKFVPAILLLGQVYEKLGKSEDAVKIWTDGYRETKNPVFIQYIEEMYIKDEAPFEILRIYQKILSEDPSDAKVRILYAKLCLRLEMIDEAISELIKLEQSGVESKVINLMLGEAYRRRGRYKEATEEFRKSLSIEQSVKLTFTCTVCKHEYPEWMAKCNNCNSWNSIDLIVVQKRSTFIPREFMLM